MRWMTTAVVAFHHVVALAAHCTLARRRFAFSLSSVQCNLRLPPQELDRLFAQVLGPVEAEHLGLQAAVRA